MTEVLPDQGQNLHPSQQNLLMNPNNPQPVVVSVDPSNSLPTESYPTILSANSGSSTISSATLCSSSLPAASIISENTLIVATLNIRAQTGLNISKQKQIEDFIKHNNIDILHCQEIEVSASTFEECHFICSGFEILTNNSPTNKYGTASIIRNDLVIQNIKLDTNGRAISFDIGNITFCNLYLHSGNDRVMRGNRESYLAENIPQLLVNAKYSGCISGDFNCIIEKRDATRNPDTKMSPGLKRLVKIFSMTDSFRQLFPSKHSFSRYYDSDRFGEGATRIDRTYHYGDVAVKEAQYVGVAFSDHMSLVVKFAVPGQFEKLKTPKSKPLFKANPDVVKDPLFKSRLQESLILLSEARATLNMDILSWWEVLVKPKIKHLLIERGKEVQKDRRGLLNLLLIRQAYLVRKLQNGNIDRLGELKLVQLEIQNWYEKDSEKIKLQGKVDEIDHSEKVRIYHHELHQKKIKRSAILKLQTDEGLLEGHHACAAYLE